MFASAFMGLLSKLVGEMDEMVKGKTHEDLQEDEDGLINSKKVRSGPGRYVRDPATLIEVRLLRM